MLLDDFSSLISRYNYMSQEAADLTPPRTVVLLDESRSPCGSFLDIVGGRLGGSNKACSLGPCSPGTAGGIPSIWSCGPRLLPMYPVSKVIGTWCWVVGRHLVCRRPSLWRAQWSPKPLRK